MDFRNINSKVKKTFPILSFSGIQLIDTKVCDLVKDGELQSKCMKAIADKYDSFAAVKLMDLSVEAEAFGSPIAYSDSEMFPFIPKNIPVMGNVYPAGQFRNGTPQNIRENTFEILEQCGGYPNYIHSSGCDISPQTPFENIDVYFEAVKHYYSIEI